METTNGGEEMTKQNNPGEYCEFCGSWLYLADEPHCCDAMIPKPELALIDKIVSAWKSEYEWDSCSQDREIMLRNAAKIAIEVINAD